MKQISDARSARNRREIPGALYSIAFLFLILFITNHIAYSQFELADLSSVVRDVKIRYNLTKTDVRRIRPMIERENEDVILIYTRYEGSTPGYSATLWREMIRRRNGFEARLNIDLTARGKSAVRAARTEMEARLLGVLVDEYVYFLDEWLELNPFQFAVADDLLKTENRIKHRLVVQYLNAPEVLEQELNRISDATNSKMARILLPSQIRLYRELLSPGSNLIG